MSAMHDRQRTHDFRGQPGKWYVSMPSLERPGEQPVGGPFETEEEARDWLACVFRVQHRGGIVWQCPDTPRERKG